MKRVAVIVGIGCVAGVAWGLFSGQSISCGDYKRDVVAVKKLFEKEKPDAAYMKFLANYTKSCPHGHDLSHIVGTRLYEALGEQGIALCDTSFTYGCYHGFFTAAIATEGEDFLHKAEFVCENMEETRRALGCFHGIGHGVLFSLGGYNLQSLEKALQRCDKLGVQQGRKSCYNGVFMEFNDQSGRAGAASPRLTDREAPLYPCDMLPSSYAADCFYEQPMVWVRSFLSSPELLGVWCTGLSSASKEQCAKGLGRAFVIVYLYDSTSTIDACRLISDRSVRQGCSRGAVEQLVSEQKPFEDFCMGWENESDACMREAIEVDCAVSGVCQRDEK